MEFTEESVRHLGDKETKHYYEVVLLETYWGKDRKEQLVILEEEVKRRGMDPEEIRRPLMDRAPKLDGALQALWTGTMYKKEEFEYREPS